MSEIDRQAFTETAEVVTTTTSTVLTALIAFQHALSAVAVVIVTFIVGFAMGVAIDVVGILWARPEDYPYEDAWLSGASIAAVLAGVAVWVLLRRRTPHVV